MRILFLRYFKFTFSYLFLLSLVAIAFSSVSLRAAEPTPEVLKDLGIDPVLGTHLSLDEEFVDESGQTVKLRSFFDGSKPVALLLNYYGCPMLCGILLNGAKKSFEGLDWIPGEHYKIVTISIDPKEQSSLAAAKKKSILDTIQSEKLRQGAEKNWHFLVGKNGSEARIAAALGFKYKWVEEEQQYAHGAALYLLSPNAKLTRVLFGIDFPSRDLKLGLLEAGEGKVGTLAEKLVLFCYHWEPKDSKFVLLASRLVSLGGAVMVVALALSYLVWFLRNRRKGNSCSLSP